MVKYVYDAWGVCDTIVLDENAANIANLNPFRYRSYYLDTGLNLYYLKTRYYDPEICRFITIDDISYLAPDTINGLNLYAYCLNNPVTYFDETGRFAEGLLFQFVVSALCYVGFSIASIWDKDVKSDMNNLGKLFGDSKNEFLSSIPNIFNTNEDIVVNSKKVSFYKGVPVIRTDFEGTFSFGAIVLSRGYTDSKGKFHRETDPNVVKHEFGHNVQLMAVGLKNYSYFIAAPSVLSNVVHIIESLIIGSKNTSVSKVYYSLPWERSADLFGGVSRPDHKTNSADIALMYLALLL